jgi:hypothetical protein
LYEAAKAGDLESMRFLLDRGVDPNAPTTVEHAQPPIFAAVVYHQQTAEVYLVIGIGLAIAGFVLAFISFRVRFGDRDDTVR